MFRVELPIPVARGCRGVWRDTRGFFSVMNRKAAGTRKRCVSLRYIRRSMFRAVHQRRISALLRGGEHFFRIGLAAFGVEDCAIRPDEVDGTFYDEAARVIKLAHLLALVHQQGKRKVIFDAELSCLPAPCGFTP